MNVAVDPRWTFAEAAEASIASYRESGRRLGVLRAWAGAVGRERALAGIEAHRLRFRSDDDAARALRVSKVSLRRLRSFFASVPSAIPVGITLYFSRQLDLLSKALVEAVLASLLNEETADCRSVYEPTESGGALVRLSGLPLEQLITIAERLTGFLYRPARAEIAAAFEDVVQPALDRAVERSLPNVIARSVAPVAVLQAQLGDRMARQIESAFSDIERTEIKLPEAVVEALRKLESEVIESKLDRSLWAWDARAGTLVRQGGWALGTGVAGNALYAFIQWVGTLLT